MGNHYERVTEAHVQPVYLPSTLSPHRRSRRHSLEQPVIQRDVGSTALLDSTLGICDGKGTVPVRHASGGRPGRYRYRSADLREIGTISQILTTYVWNTPVVPNLYLDA